MLQKFSSIINLGEIEKHSVLSRFCLCRLFLRLFWSGTSLESGRHCEKNETERVGAGEKTPSIFEDAGQAELENEEALRTQERMTIEG